MESIGYVLMYFLRGSLPWQGLQAATKHQKYEKILEKKVATSVEVLCKNYPVEFRSYFEHVKGLSFCDRPDYDYLKRLFRELFFRMGFTYDNTYDWQMLPHPFAPPSQAQPASEEAQRGAGDALKKAVPPASEEWRAKFDRRDIPQARPVYRMGESQDLLALPSHMLSQQLPSQSLTNQESFQFGVQAHHRKYLRDGY